jgi:hypothetical protein
MLRRLPQHHLMRGCAELFVDAARYVAFMLVVIVLLGQAAKLAF